MLQPSTPRAPMGTKGVNVYGKVLSVPENLYEESHNNFANFGTFSRLQ